MRTLVLNLDFNPLSIVSGYRGLVLSLRNKNMTVLKYYDLTITSEHDIFEIPAVMLYNRFVSSPESKNISKRYVLARDKMICQYCSKKLNSTNCSVDHVIPASRFDVRSQANTWDNLVAACKSCNTKKRDRTPLEAGMGLISKPRQPNGFLMIESGPKEWEIYLGSRMQNSGLAVET
jgi:5-methylcytosine-specific restriction endonuclease McrA